MQHAVIRWRKLDNIPFKVQALHKKSYISRPYMYIGNAMCHTVIQHFVLYATLFRKVLFKSILKLAHNVIFSLSLSYLMHTLQHFTNSLGSNWAAQFILTALHVYKHYALILSPEKVQRIFLALLRVDIWTGQSLLKIIFSSLEIPFSLELIPSLFTDQNKILLELKVLLYPINYSL